MNVWVRSKYSRQPITVTAGAFPLDSDGWEAVFYSVGDIGPSEVLGRTTIVDGRFDVVTPPGWVGRFQVELVAPDGARILAGHGELVDTPPEDWKP